MASDALATNVGVNRSEVCVMESRLAPPLDATFELRGLRSEGMKIVPHLVPDAPENRQPCRIGTLQHGRVLKVLVNCDRLSWKDRAAFPRIVTNRQDVIERLSRELVDALRSMAGDINAEFSHHGHRFGSDLARLGPSAENFKTFPGVVP